MSKNLKNMIIGPSGIGKVHIRESINFGFQNIYLLGKKYKAEREASLIKEYKNVNFFNLKSIDSVQKIKPDIINLCSPTKNHHTQIKIIKKFCKYLIIEKPIFWIKNKNISNLKVARDLLNLKRNRIFVNLPMISLANQIKKKNKFKKIKLLNFNYFTKGKNKFEDVPIDLLPHALSFLFTLNSNKLNNLEILEINKKSNSWQCKIIINDCFCKFFFKQNPKSQKSTLSFKINEDTYLRKNFVKKKFLINKVLKNKKKLITIKNPMSDYLNLIFKNLNKNKVLKKNNDITLNSIKIMEKLINY
tara:strand:+ start:402 stop:1310 length:909 start_codon:yes stop_codon:yes gene_type:complete